MNRRKRPRAPKPKPLRPPAVLLLPDWASEPAPSPVPAPAPTPARTPAPTLDPALGAAPPAFPDAAGLGSGPAKARRSKPKTTALIAAAVLLVNAAAIAGVVALTGASTSNPSADEAGAAAPRAAPRSTTTPSTAVASPTTTSLPPPADPAAPARIIGGEPDQPNPFVLVDQGWHYLYSSQCCWLAPQIPVRVSGDRENWGPMVDALPLLPPWAQVGYTWAPDVRWFAGRYLMYFTAAVNGVLPRTQCIGAAQAALPTGPFVPAPEPIVCQQERGGSIDPRTFVDADGTLWLHWKSDDNAREGTTKASIYAQRLSDDGLSFIGDRFEIMTADQEWEGRIVEAPHMLLVDGRYWLFYSGNWFNQPIYGIGVASCAGPAGPCTKPYSRPFLSTNAQGAGPGESSHFVDDDGIWIVYGPNAVDFETVTPRPIALARIAFNEQGPYLAAF